jgi:leucyl aminopeptidase
MKLMKKDMGGAALVLGLAHAIMSQNLPVRLRVLIPAVENSVAGNAMRPLDVLDSRKGITVEVGDTDAEGRLILADALTLADAENPDLIIDAATLTGAARVALGTSLPAIFTTLDSTWKEIEEACDECADPVWRLPLHHAYKGKLSSKVADLSNISGDAFAGAIIAALFLNEFVSKDRDWVHMDTMGYNIDARPGRPAGGEALGLLTLDAMLRQRFAPRDNTASDTTALGASTSGDASSDTPPRKAGQASGKKRSAKKKSEPKAKKKPARRSRG